MKRGLILFGVAFSATAYASGGRMKPTWSAESVVENIPSVVADRDSVFSCEGSEILCNSLASGQLKWRKQLTTKRFSKSGFDVVMLDHFLIVPSEYNDSMLQIVDKRTGAMTSVESPDRRNIVSIVPVHDKALICLSGDGEATARTWALEIEKGGTAHIEKQISTDLLNQIVRPFVLDGRPYQILNRNSKAAFIGGFDINYEHYPLAKSTTDIWIMPEGWHAFITRSRAEEYRREMPFERPVDTLSLWSNGGLGRQYWSHSSYVGDGFSLFLGGADIVVWHETVWTTGGVVYRISKEPDQPFVQMKNLQDVFAVRDELFGRNDKGQLFRYVRGRFVLAGTMPGIPVERDLIQEIYETSNGLARWIRTHRNGKFEAKLEYYQL